jgi:hypothetical protein
MINNLLEDVLLYVLSFLPTEDDVRTSIFSKKGLIQNTVPIWNQEQSPHRLSHGVPSGPSQGLQK